MELFTLHIFTAHHAPLALSPENVNFLPSPLGLAAIVGAALMHPILMLDLCACVDPPIGSRSFGPCPSIGWRGLARGVARGLVLSLKTSEEGDNAMSVGGGNCIVEQFLANPTTEIVSLPKPLVPAGILIALGVVR
jgi:hypothetical protein